MGKLGYYILKTAAWVIHLFPMRINYTFSDFLYYFIFYIFRYRRSVVYTNLKNSFPEKSERERTIIARKFYHHLCDIFYEVLYFNNISKEEAKKRCRFLNPEAVNHYLDQGRATVIFLGHYNNWEWLTAWSLYSRHRFYAIYKKLTDKAFDRFFFNLRSRLGAVPLERADTFRQLVVDHQKGIPTFSSFIFDQTPRINEIQYWTTFLNQDTAVLVGGEKVARKLDAAVFYLHMKKIKRGYYEVEFTLMTDQPNETEKFEITEKCTRFLENIIREEPACWLWSHRRWKHKRQL